MAEAGELPAEGAFLRVLYGDEVLLGGSRGF